MVELLQGLRYWAAVLFVISIPGAIAYWFVVHPLAKLLRGLGTRLAMALVLGLFGATIPLLFLVRDQLLIRDLGFEPILFAIGVPFYLAAFVGQLLTRRQLSNKIMIGVPELSEGDPGQLLTEGVFAWTRNPRYLVIWSALFGMALMTNYLGTWVQALLSFPALYLVVLLEEKELRQRFGEPYLDYCRSVPRFFPRRPATEARRSRRL